MLGLKNSSARLIPCVQNEHMLLCLSHQPSYVLEMAFTVPSSLLTSRGVSIAYVHTENATICYYQI